MALAHLPELEALFSWGDENLLPALRPLADGAQCQDQELVTPEGRRPVPGRVLSLLSAVSLLAAVPAAALRELPASHTVWVLASKLALELVARERVLPTLRRQRGRVEARWAAALASAEDAARVTALAVAMPPAAHALPVASEGSLEVWAPDALLRAFLDSAVDALVREARAHPGARARCRPRRSDERQRLTGWPGCHPRPAARAARFVCGGAACARSPGGGRGSGLREHADQPLDLARAARVVGGADRAPRTRLAAGLDRAHGASGGSARAAATAV